MIGPGVLDWLRRRDAGLRISLRALRLTIVTLPLYYICLYAIGNGVLATYAVFGVIAAGIFIQLPGQASRRAVTLLAALPAGCALIAVGTALNVNVWVAVVGTLVIGFSIAFFGVAGPRLVGLAGGLQLFYLVANFSPHHLSALPARLIGAVIGVALTAAAEVLLWPDPPPQTYQWRVGAAAEAIADLLDAAARVVSGEAGAEGEAARQGERAGELVQRVRILGTPRTERPTSAGRRDRALRDCAWTIWELAEQARRLLAWPRLASRHDADAAALMRRCAASMRDASRALLHGGSLPEVKVEPSTAGPGLDATPSTGARSKDVDRLRLGLTLRAIVLRVEVFAVATRVAVRAPTLLHDERLSAGARSLWFASHSDLYLFWLTLKQHLTLRSVYFQSALRLAVALAAARAVSGLLDLSHGFWVLLATLTVMRSSALNTRATLIRSIIGAVIGAVATGLLLRFSPGAVPYAAGLVVTSLLAFGLGSLLGAIWSQAALTAMVTLVFAQLAPADWRLAGIRLVDVAAGGAVGILAGLLMWPKGAGGELCRRITGYLTANADLIVDTITTLAGRGRYRERPHDALNAPHREYLLAEASACLYYAERPDPRFERMYWEAFILAGNYSMHGAQYLLHRNPPGFLRHWPEAVDAMTDIARQLRAGYLNLARELPNAPGGPRAIVPLDGAMIGDRAAAIAMAGDGRPEDECLLEVANWLAALSENLDWLEREAGRSPQPEGPAQAGASAPADE